MILLKNSRQNPLSWVEKIVGSPNRAIDAMTMGLYQSAGGAR